MTFASEIEDFCDGAENIESVIVGVFGWGYGDEPDHEAYRFEDSGRKPIPQGLKFKPQPWAAMRDYLDYNYDSGFGSADCHAVLVYTEHIIVSVYEYDGSTQFVLVDWSNVDERF